MRQNVINIKKKQLKYLKFLLFREHSHLESAMKNILNKQSEGILVFYKHI